jgi:LasA protease
MENQQILKFFKHKLPLIVLIIIMLPLSGCLAELPTAEPPYATPTPEPTPTLPLPTPMATRPIFQPGELVDYTAQSGDTLKALAARFNTSVDEILHANPIIPADATTMPPGMPMRIPIYYRPLWGSPYQIIPDGLFPNGPAQRGFDTTAFVDQQPGWLKNYTHFAGGQNRRGGALIDLVAMNYSVSPRLLLAIIEYQSGALSNPEPPGPADRYPLGKKDYRSEGLYRQTVWAADLLNQGYYKWRIGRLLDFDLLDGRQERPDPWQNAATVAIQHYFSRIMNGEAYTRAISSVGLAETYRALFGDPWEYTEIFIPGSLQQPPMQLPFQRGAAWAFTGGPHNAWGDEEMPLAALDFAPPSLVGGCTPSSEWSTAVADGVIARNGPAIAVLDLDGDGDERTGWTVFYLHLEPGTIAPVGKKLKAGDPIGRPSCEGGRSTGTHVHIARKFNGEWILAEGILAFNLEGWVAYNGAAPYQGSLRRHGQTVNACVCSNKESQITSIGPVVGP